MVWPVTLRHADEGRDTDRVTGVMTVRSRRSSRGASLSRRRPWPTWFRA